MNKKKRQQQQQQQKRQQWNQQSTSKETEEEDVVGIAKNLPDDVRGSQGIGEGNAGAGKNFEFRCVLLKEEVDVEATITPTFEATIRFTVVGQPNRFLIKHWSKTAESGIEEFLNFFHLHKHRDPVAYGVRTEGPQKSVLFLEKAVVEGTSPEASPRISSIQIMNCLEVGCRNIMANVAAISEKHGDRSLHYAVTVLKNLPDPSSYLELIHFLTCRCMRKSSLDFAPASNMTEKEFLEWLPKLDPSTYPVIVERAEQPPSFTVGVTDDPGSRTSDGDSGV